MVDIIIFSDNTGPEKNVEAKTDDTLPISIISKSYVTDLGSSYQSCSLSTVKDSESRSYSVIGSVKLRWHKKGKQKSYAETFHVVDNNTCTVILGKSAFPKDASSPEPQVHTLGLASQTAVSRAKLTMSEFKDEKRRQEQKKVEAQQRRAEEKKKQEEIEAQKRAQQTRGT